MGKAAELREQAIAAFKAADELIVDDQVPAEQQETFDTKIAEGQDLMKQYQAASATEGKIVQVRTMLEDVASAVKGAPITFSAHHAEVERGKSWGQQFVDSEAYKSLAESGALVDGSTRKFSSPAVAVKAASDIINTTDPATGAGALVTPDYLPGVYPIGMQPLTIRDLFSQAGTNSDTISYAQQQAAEGAAEAVAQSTTTSGNNAAGGLKPQASVSWVRQTTPVETIAVWMAATRQALADPGQIRGLIDNQLTYLVKLEEEDQLLNGNGTSPNLSGIYDQTDLQSLDLTGLDNLDGIRTARRMVQTGTSRLRADGIVLHPADSEQFDLLKDLYGQYRGGNPIGNFQFDQPIWSLRRVESESIDEGKALVGAFRPGATVYERQGVQILTADQHADFFVRNLVVILAEERIALAVFFPTAFVDVTLADWGS